jgi:hypothetical protein
MSGQGPDRPFSKTDRAKTTIVAHGTQTQPGAGAAAAGGSTPGTDAENETRRRAPHAPMRYRVSGEVILVIGCFHGSRDPNSWRDR